LKERASLVEMFGISVFLKTRITFVGSYQNQGSTFWENKEMFGIISRLGQIFLKLLGTCYCLPTSSVLCFSIIHTYLQAFMLRFHAFCFVLDLNKTWILCLHFPFQLSISCHLLLCCFHFLIFTSWTLFIPPLVSFLPYFRSRF